MKINVYRLKRGKEEILKDWGVTIHKEKGEALASLIEENCLSESMKIFSIKEDIYVVGAMCAEKGKELLAHNPNREINKKHIKILNDVLDGPLALEDIYTLTVE